MAWSRGNRISSPNRIMKTHLFPIIAAIGIFLTTSIHAEDTKAPKPEELEAKFKDAMTAVTMSGRWCSLKDGVLGPEKVERYTIVSVQNTKACTKQMNIPKM